MQHEVSGTESVPASGQKSFCARWFDAQELDIFLNYWLNGFHFLPIWGMGIGIWKPL